jgi:hypothetical protein
MKYVIIEKSKTATPKEVSPVMNSRSLLEMYAQDNLIDLASGEYSIIQKR